ncbi:hypothetical protein NQZ68_028426 [Dissostichus eleginoides]|nr:hypothetical protein NQZ68_028426 [Dissostichus eleginoides]
MKNLRRAVNPRPKRYPPDLESLQHTPENALIACIADLCGHRRYRPRDNKSDIGPASGVAMPM